MASMRSKLMRLVIKMLSRRGKMRQRPFSEIRAAADRGAIGSVPGGVTVEPLDIGELRAEYLIPAEAEAGRALLYLHGGGFISGSLTSHRPWVGRLARATGLRCLQIDYRLAPEHPFPAALDDALAAYELLLESGLGSKGVVVAGESAGANLALSLALVAAERGLPRPAGLVALSPWVDLQNGSESIEACADTELFFTPDELEWIAELYAGDQPLDDPRISPLFGALETLPPVLLQASDNEMFRDDARRLAEAIVARGGQVELRLWSGMFHGFQLVEFLPESRAALASIVEFVRRCGLQADGERPEASERTERTEVVA